jgi:hypothetical protein
MNLTLRLTCVREASPAHPFPQVMHRMSAVMRPLLRRGAAAISRDDPGKRAPISPEKADGTRGGGGGGREGGGEGGEKYTRRLFAADIAETDKFA